MLIRVKLYPSMCVFCFLQTGLFSADNNRPSVFLKLAQSDLIYWDYAVLNCLQDSIPALGTREKI